MQCASNRSGSGLLGPFLWRFGLRSAQHEIAFTIKCIVLPIPRGPIHLADCALLGPDVGARILRYWENTEGIDVREYRPFLGSEITVCSRRKHRAFNPCFASKRALLNKNE